MTISNLARKLTTEKEARTANSTYPKVAVQWLNQALCFYQSYFLVNSEVFRNRHLRVGANRPCPQPKIQVYSALP